MDEAIAAATEESESESTCSVRSRSSETLLLSEDEHVAHDKPVGSPRSALSPYCISPETNVPIPWSCSDVLLDRPAALELQGVEAMEEVQAMVTEQFEQYEQATTIMSYVHGKLPNCFVFWLRPNIPLCLCSDLSLVDPSFIFVV